MAHTLTARDDDVDMPCPAARINLIVTPMRFIVSRDDGGTPARACFQVGNQWHVISSNGFHTHWLLKPEVRHGDVEFDVPKMAFSGAQTLDGALYFYFEQYGSGFYEHLFTLDGCVHRGEHLAAYLPTDARTDAWVEHSITGCKDEEPS